MKFLTALLIFSINGATALAEGTRGGGHPDGLDFIRAAKRAAQDLMSDGNTFKVDLNLLQKTISEMNVLVVDENLPVNFLDLNQQSVAINEPAKSLIQINSNEWKKIVDEKLKRALALHEVLSLMKIESTGRYPVSLNYLTTRGYQCVGNLCDAPPVPAPEGFHFQPAAEAFDLAVAPTATQLSGTWALVGIAPFREYLFEERSAYKVYSGGDNYFKLIFGPSEDAFGNRSNLTMKFNNSKPSITTLSSTGACFSSNIVWIRPDRLETLNTDYLSYECRMTSNQLLLCARVLHSNRSQYYSDWNGKVVDYLGFVKTI